MATYVIGDVQGCYTALQQLLLQCHFQSTTDHLWFCGDLINRGPESLAVLRFVKSLGNRAITVLGNHDLGLLVAKRNPNTITSPAYHEILAAPDAQELCDWLQQCPLLHHDPAYHAVLTHAGIWPFWDIHQAKMYASEVESTLKSPDADSFLAVLWGDTPTEWNSVLTGWDRLRFIVNAFTRMRYCKPDGSLLFDTNDDNQIPWFSIPNRKSPSEKILFGHWAALRGMCPIPNIIALDTGYIWGGALTAYRLEDGQYFRLPAPTL